MAQALANWLKLFRQTTACGRALENPKVGSTSTAKMPAVAMTTNKSVNVNPLWSVRPEVGAVNKTPFRAHA
jgi:hypothetical protein